MLRLVASFKCKGSTGQKFIYSCISFRGKASLAQKNFKHKGMLHHLSGGAFIFLPLKLFIAPALDFMPCSQARGMRDCNGSIISCIGYFMGPGNPGELPHFRGLYRLKDRINNPLPYTTLGNSLRLLEPYF